MTGETLKQRLLDRLLRRGPGSEELVAFVVEHLLDGCSDCRREHRSLSISQRSARVAEIEQVTNRVEQMAHRWYEQVENERPVAERLLAQLVSLPAAERSRRLAQASRESSSPTLVLLLIEESQRRLADEPYEALELARVAADLARGLPAARYGTAFPRDLATRAVAHKGNALRVLGELRAAADELEEALSAVEESADPLLLGEVLSLTASLRRDQRRFEEARELLERATGTYRSVNEEVQVGHQQLLLAAILFQQGRFAAALESNDKALELLANDPTSRTYLVGVHNRATYLAELGHYTEAQEVLRAHRELYRQFTADRGLQLRLSWLRALIASGLNRRDEAAQELASIRVAFKREGWHLDAALVALDLAALCLEEGRNEEVKQIAVETINAFQAQDLDREAMAALRLFRQAAAAETLTRAMLREVVGALRRVGPSARVRRQDMF